MADPGTGLRVQFREMGVREGGSPVVTYAGTHLSVTRTLRIPWARLQEACWQLVGTAQMNEDGTIHRDLPQEDWDWKGLYATHIDRGRGIGYRGRNEYDYGSTANYEYAEVAVEFLPRPYKILADEDVRDPSAEAADNEFMRYVEYLPNYSAEYLSIPNGVLYWSEGPCAGKPFPGSAGKIFVRADITYRWHEVPDGAFNEEAHANLLGHVNHKLWGDGVEGSIHNYQPGTLLYLGNRPVRHFFVKDNKPRWTIDLLFGFNPNGWNNFVNFREGHCVAPNTNPTRERWAYRQVTTDGAVKELETAREGDLVFTPGNFKNLFLSPDAFIEDDA